MARFIVADITDPSSIPQELEAIVPNLRSVPLQPLLLQGASEYGMFKDYRQCPWVLPVYIYPSPDELMADLASKVIEPAEAKVAELRR